MSLRQIVPGVYQISLRSVNCFLLQTEDGSILIDTGLPEHAVPVLTELRAAGVEEPTHIMVTHCHPDHAGGLAFLKSETGAQTWGHPDDARLIEDGVALRPLHPAPGTFNRLMSRMMAAKSMSSIPACVIDHKVEHGHMLAGGLIAIHTPGHSAGHLCFLWPERKVLIAGDVASHAGWLRPSPVYEDYRTGLESLKRLGDLKFDVATFGHGMPIRKEAVRRFRARFGVPG